MPKAEALPKGEHTVTGIDGNTTEPAPIAPSTVRAATKADYAALQAVFDEVEAFHRDGLPQVFRKPKTTFPPRSLFNSFIEDTSSTLLVAVLDGQLAGFVTVREGEMPDDPILVPRRLAVVDMLAVAKDRQRRGLGRALMEGAHSWARDRGIDHIELNVWEFNQQAITFYHELGYTTASRLLWRSL